MNPAERRAYKKKSDSIRASIVTAHEQNEDWKAICNGLGISYFVAYYWIKSGRKSPLQKGGATYTKKRPEYVERLIIGIEENQENSFEVTAILSGEFDVNVNISTIKRWWLDGEMFSIKRIRLNPISMNSAENKMARKIYKNYFQHKAQNRSIIWIDESNVNHFCKGAEGRSKIGSRCSLIDLNSRGDNIHMIGAISQTNVVKISVIGGSFTKEACQEWLREAINDCHERGRQSLTIICDNAPCHKEIEKTINHDEDVKILRLAS